MKTFKKSNIISIGILLCVLILPNYTNAQAGSLDPTFGIDGLVITDISGNHDFGYSVAIQEDGKIVVGGFSGGWTDPSFSLVRFNSNGTLDDSFGIEGKVITSIGMHQSTGYSLAIQTDGKIILGGYFYSFEDGIYEICVVRYNTNGTLDSLFGIEGIVTTNINIDEEEYDLDEAFGYSILIQPDGKIIISGTKNLFLVSGKFIAIRYNTDGTIDDSFGNSGIAVPDLDGSYYGLTSALQPDGKILLAGGSKVGSNTDFAIIRLDENGNLDDSFGIEGIVTTDFNGYYDLVNSLLIKSDGRIIATGLAGNDDDPFATYDFAVACYQENGSLDTSFGSEGIATYESLTGHDIGDRIVAGFLPFEKIILGGKKRLDDHDIFALYCLDGDGNLDLSFGEFGSVTTDFDDGNNECIYSIAIQEDDKIVVVGKVYGGASYDIGLARYNTCSANFTIIPDSIPHVWNIYSQVTGAEPIAYFWEWGDGTFSNEEFPSHMYSEPGNYNICLTITDATGCSYTYCDSSTYINRLNNESTLIYVNVIGDTSVQIQNIYSNTFECTPNPFTSELIINLQYFTVGRDYITIYNTTGNPVIQKEINSNNIKIDTENFSAGIYIVKVTSGGINQNLKVIKLD